MLVNAFIALQSLQIFNLSSIIDENVNGRSPMITRFGVKTLKSFGIA